MTVTAETLAPLRRSDLHARPAGLLRDISTVAGRALRAIPREVESVIPAIFIALFFFLVNIGTLDRVTERHPRLQVRRLLDRRPPSCSASRA